MSWNFFCCATDNYVPQCVITLLSFRRFYPNQPCFIVGSRFSNKSNSLMNSFQIHPILVPHLKKYFFRQYKYPVECYFHFYGPYLFKRRNFAYSVFLDGDLYCNQKFHLSVPSLAGRWFGARNYNTVGALLKRDLSKIRILWPSVSTRHEYRPRPQTGVLFYNNHNLCKIKYFTKIQQLYRKSYQNAIPRKGDDSLLALFIMTQNKVRFNNLSKYYNLVERYGSFERLGIIYHFVPFHKPWNIDKKKRASKIHRYFVGEWLKIFHSSFTPEQIKQAGFRVTSST